MQNCGWDISFASMQPIEGIFNELFPGQNPHLPLVTIILATI